MNSFGPVEHRDYMEQNSRGLGCVMMLLGALAAFFLALALATVEHHPHGPQF